MFAFLVCVFVLSQTGRIHSLSDSWPLALLLRPTLFISHCRYRGIGVRIEDDVAVTEGEPIVLTRGVPKEVDELEGIIGRTPMQASPIGPVS